MSIMSRVKFKIFKLNNKLLTLKINGNKRIALVSCEKYKNKLMEDYLVKHYLNKENILVDIVAYEYLNIDYSKYDLVLIRSIWGYQNNLDLFYRFLDKLKNSNALVLNNINLIKDNHSKENQYNLFKENNINCIESIFLDAKKLINYEQNREYVVKPVISASGDNTFKFTGKYKGPSNLTGKYMIQNYVEGINEGEYSVIYFSGKYSHTIKRFSGVLTSNKKLEYIDKVDASILELSNKVSKLYKDYLFLRVDIIKNNNEYLVLESELIDPSFFFGILPKDVRIEKINMLVSNITQYLK